ncbi:DinB family protein [Paenibacillus oenotherae]|uniref:DinB family protein n=1 Tax=Paenibacillus oenotherae TaxID=1435645 RepID=A0ABS7DBK9_9BACL|nr:DinB family protein [Paenibacillus oenotherae]MBW7477159.1 DinB family protein [Paenibacillus oenotherae]
MNTMEALKRLEDHVVYYLHELEGFSIEQLQRKPSEDEWSLGQMYQHLINSALHMHLRNIEQCMTQSGDASASPAEQTKDGAAIFEQGGFPPIRIQVPASPQYTPGQPESKEQLILGLNSVVQRMKEIEPTLEKAPSNSTVSHPRFGALHAKEWYLLIEMHYRHHLLQLTRLKNALESSV